MTTAIQTENLRLTNRYSRGIITTLSVNLTKQIGDPMDVIKVSATSRTSAVAGAIAGVFRDHDEAVVQAIGAGAVNQALKAMVLATGYLEQDGIHVSFVPEFADVTIEDQVRTAIRLVIKRRAQSDSPSHIPRMNPSKLVNEGNEESPP